MTRLTPSIVVPMRVRRGVAGVLDLGSFKTACLIAAIEPDRPPRVVGIAQAPSRGVKSGVVLDLAEAEQSALAAIAEAERMAGVRLPGIAVTASCGRLSSRHFSAATDVAGSDARLDDLARLWKAASDFAGSDGRRAIHLAETSVTLDGQLSDTLPLVQSARNAAGNAARRLGAEFHAVTADPTPVRNLEHVVERCYLSADMVLPGPLASGLATTTDEERAAGVLVLDIGAGVTGISAFANGAFVVADAVPMGSLHITLDIAQSLRAPLEEAERIKVVCGTLILARSDTHEPIEIRTSIENGTYGERFTKADLCAVIRRRVDIVLDHVARRLDASGLPPRSIGSVVVTGGASELPGLVEYTEKKLARPVRVGRPYGMSGLPPEFAKPAFAGLVGGLGTMIETMAHPLAAHQGDDRALGYFGRVGQWLKSGF
ncbi:MAG: cell division protein FtsA [Hyphomicrobium sp.]|nr:cell division protein FtsA [Hyphomicrobium sp.]